MNEAMQKELLAKLDALAAKLGVGASEVWRILIQQARIEAIKDAALALVALAVLIYLCPRIPALLSSEGKSWEQEGRDTALGVGVVVVCAICLLVVLFCATSVPTELFNPEYWALKQILGAIAK